MDAQWGRPWGRLAMVLAAGRVLLACGTADDAPHETPADRDGERALAAPEVVLEPEAGFVAVGLDGALTAPVVHRLFYSFHPAESHPEDAPVLVFFNGGPGSATTSVLWVYGTAPYSLDPDVESGEDAGPAPNPLSYTSFANLLYIDARSTGFSYELLSPEPLPSATPSRADLTSCPEADARLLSQAACAGSDAFDFVEVLLDFLDTHPALANNRVVLVGESYGGIRSTVLLSMLQHYGSAMTDGVPDYGCAFPWLRDRVQAHFDVAFPPDEGKVRTPDEVAEQFGWQVLIQPGLFMGYEWDQELMDPDMGPYLATAGHHGASDARRTEGWDEQIVHLASGAILDAAKLELLLGTSPASVELLSPQTGRGDAFRSTYSNFNEDALRERLGHLTDDDAYWVPFVSSLTWCDWALELSIFYEMVSRTHTFVTNARFDPVVWTDALRAKFELDRGAEYDADQPADAVRPGVIRFAADDGRNVEIRFPDYDSGHMVTVGAPREFREDVEAWLAEKGALRQREHRPRERD